MSGYFPARGEWARVAPADAGMSGEALAAAAQYAQQHDSQWPYSLYLPDGRYIGNAYVGDKPPHDQPIGIVRPRGGPAGLVVRAGRVVAQWGDVSRADTTYSAAKSYVALVAGLAYDDGLIRSLDDRVSGYALDDGFSSDHNTAITWRHLLQQTSEWQGAVWGKPDSVDHNRQVGAHETDHSRKGVTRELEPPGTRWEYNDVRVNRLALCLTQLFRRSLADVLRERIMEPIGASTNWEWRGYDNARVRFGELEVESVSGGGHWGAGLFISTEDHARVGLLVARGGEWQGRRLISDGYLDELTRPCAANPQYGFMWWLNTGRGLFPSVPEDGVFALGGGQHIVWVAPSLDLVAVTRWVDKPHCDALLGRIASAFA
ncbi:serine hydrolase domain-containing protein [Ramlibacter rhizophilus]|uniref:Class C beta-lactamase-related serine hydrolase n=1 Tax=Ramlibacter rhizophilus TaxID=1781167 RepID=A0A4Z0C242_9BURK|nr:serine hydrolase [Ramlibacter rhizophilus]TFZ05022.1 class C beta-lactamase-related serine hydrolase [Ramlibacter rhizophilus]